MKTKVLALLLTMLMLVSLAFAGCGAKELTPEEYVKKAIDVSLAEVTKKTEPAKISLGVGDILPILEMAGADTSAIPPVEAVTLSVYGGSNTDIVMQLSALVNNQLCDAMLGYKTNKGEIVAKTNLLNDVYSVNLEELMALAGSTMTIPSVAEMMDSYIALVQPILDSMVKNSTLTKTEGKGEVTVHFAMDAEGIVNLAIEALEAMAADEFFANYLSTVAYEDINDVIAQIKAEKDDAIAEGKDMGVALNMDMVINKSTYKVLAENVVVTVDGETVTANVTYGDGSISAVMNFFDEIDLTFSAVYTKDTLDLDFKLVPYDEEAFTLNIDADGKEAVIKMYIPGDETELSVKADYTVSKNGFAATLTSVGVNGVALDVSDMEITLSVENGVSVPALPEATKNLLQMSEDEIALIGQEIVINLISKAGLLSYMQ